MNTTEKTADKIVICDVCGAKTRVGEKYFEYVGTRNDRRGDWEYSCCSGRCCLAVDRWLRTSKGYPEYSRPEGQPSHYLLKEKKG